MQSSKDGSLREKQRKENFDQNTKKNTTIANHVHRSEDPDEEISTLKSNNSQTNYKNVLETDKKINKKKF